MGDDYAEELKKFLNEVSEAERDLEVERVLKSFKLNPWDQLGIEFATPEKEIKKIYRKKSLLVHPDKCKHPKAQEAFDVLKKAQEACVDEDQRRVMKRTLQDAMDMIMHEKSLKPNDPYLETDDFKKECKKAANKILVDIEWRKRQIEKRIAEEEEKARKEEEEAKEERKRKAAAEKLWEDSRDTRVQDWRSFMNGAKKKKLKQREKGSDLSSDIAFKMAQKNAAAQKNVAANGK